MSRASAGLDIEMYGMGVAVGDYNNDGFPDILITCVGQSRLFKNTGKGTFVDVTKTSGLGGQQAFSTSAIWFDYDRDGLLDLFVCNYVKWSPEHDVFCSLDGKHKSYCTPEAYRGETCWLFHNRGNGTFEDVTASSGIFDSSSKSLGVAMLDYDQDGWPDLLVANDTQPNKLYRNQRNGTFQGCRRGSRARFQRGRQSARRHGRGRRPISTTPARPGVAITNFDNEMIGLYRARRAEVTKTSPRKAELGLPRKTAWVLAARFSMPISMGRSISPSSTGTLTTRCAIFAQCGLRATSAAVSERRQGKFRDVAGEVGGGFSQPKVGRGLAYADFDRDGDLDVLITTNNGPAYLYRNDQTGGNQSVAFSPDRHKVQSRCDWSNSADLPWGDSPVELSQSRLVKGGSSYLIAIGAAGNVWSGPGATGLIELVIDWPSGGTEEFKNLAAGRAYECVEGKGIKALSGF